MKTHPGHLILWLGDPSHPWLKRLDQASSLATIETKPSAKKKYDLVLGSIKRLSTLKSLQELKEASAATVWALLDEDSENYISLINSQLIDSFFESAFVPEDIEARLTSALKLAQNRRHAWRLKQDLQKQNLELTAMAERLEDLVAERTGVMQKSKIELEQQTQRVQNLVRFVSDLSRWHDVDELLMYLRSELRIFHELSDPILFWILPRGSGEIVFWQGQQLQRRNCEARPHQILKMRLHDRSDQVFLAAQLGRPVGRTVALPLAMGSRPSVLFFEHALTEAKLQRLLQVLEERIQVLQITWERIFGEREALQASLQWERVFDTMADPIAIIDKNFKPLRSNKRFAIFSGERCFERWAERSSPCPGCPLLENIMTGTPQLINVHDKLWYVYSYPILGGEQVEAYVNHYVDVTDTKKLFEKSVQNEKMAALGLLAGHIAHELNNPLTGIQSLAQVVIEDPGIESQTKDDLKEVERAAFRSQKIIENFLEFSRGSSKLETVDLNIVVQRTLPMLKTAFREHQTEFIWNEDALPVHVESHLLQQVVFNLVNNACQAMKDTGVLTLQTLSDGAHAVLLVQDTGVGMNEDVAKRIFEPFFTTKKEGVGTGLGLSLSRSIVEKFGGSIEMTTEVGAGSTFRVKLPLVGEL